MAWINNLKIIRVGWAQSLEVQSVLKEQFEARVIQNADGCYLVKRNDEEQLESVVQRHFDVVDALCPGVKLVEAKNLFVESVVAEQMGWKEIIQDLEKFKIKLGLIEMLDVSTNPSLSKG